MGRSRIRWAADVVAPWCLSLGVLLALVPDAGQTATFGGMFLPLTRAPAALPGDLVPATAPTLPGFSGLSGFSALSGPGEAGARIERASYDVGSAAALALVPDDQEPRGDLKAGTDGYPTLDRSRKGDPAIGLRPTFDTRLRQPDGLRAVRTSQLIAPHDDALPAASFSLQDSGDPLDGTTRFAPWSEDDAPETADRDDHRAGTSFAVQPAALRERLLQGATPRVSRAEALASTTPAPADGTPVEATFAVPLPSGPGVSVVPRIDGRPDYAALLRGEHGARERKCLAEAVYFEARSEPEEGQAAVAQVVLNRATSGLYPSSICGVVYQNRTHYKACQFSFACEGKSLRVSEPESWHTAERIADAVIAGKTYLADVGGATHYHAKYVRPGWARRLVKMDMIGHHVFYRLRAGQT